MQLEELRAASLAHHETAEWWQRRANAWQAMQTSQLPAMPQFNYQHWPLLKQDQLIWQASKPVRSDKFATTIQQVGQSIHQLNLSNQLIAAGVRVADIFSNDPAIKPLIDQYLGTVVQATENQLTAFHYAYLNAGLFIYLPANGRLNSTLDLELIQDSRLGHAWNQHVLLVAAPGAQAQIMVHTSTIGQHENSVNIVMEVIAGANSNIHVSSLNELGATTTTYFNQRALLHRHANVDWSIGMMNAGNTVGQIDSELIGEGSSTHSKMIAVTVNNQHVGINNRVTNRGLHTTGLINQRGVLNDYSELVLNGIGQIVHGAHGANADQQNRVLMMSDQAHGDANPVLLIDENDVQAGHAASVGPVDPQQMYYLMSRGIPRDQAERLVIRGFLNPVLADLPEQNVRSRMIELLERKLRDEAGA